MKESQNIEFKGEWRDEYKALESSFLSRLGETGVGTIYILKGSQRAHKGLTKGSQRAHNKL